MEVFIRNVPQQSNDKALRNFLRPTFKNLSIQNVKYDNHFGKPFASLTFLNISDAEKFLKYHGQVRGTLNKKPVPINQALYVQLRFLGQPIYCEKSNRDANPFTLRGLQREEKERQLQDHERDRKPKQPEIFPVEFRTFSVSCGTWAYHFDDLVFAPQVTWDVDGTAKFGKRSMILTLDSGFRIDFRYSAVDGIATQDLPCPSFIFSMTEPPRLFEKIPEDPVASLLAQLGFANRARPFVQRKGPERHRLPCLSADHEPIVGNCLAYRITLGKGYSISPKTLHEISELIEKLKKAHEMPPMVHGVTSIYPDGERYSEAFQLLRESLSSLAIGLPFEVAFQVHKLAQNNYLPPMTILELLPDIREMYELSKLTVTVAAVRKLFNQIPYPGPDVEAKVFELEHLRELLVANEASVIKEGLSVDFTPQSNVAVIHRIKITPTGMYLYGPEPETNNRILRKYSTHHDCFLRVQFCDEDGQPLFFNSRVSSYRIFHGRFKHILQDGIEVGGRTFHFLGFSHSSLRMQSCWFVTPFFHNGELITDRMIIMGLGNFTPIRSPAKCAARIGQAFSDTPTAVPFPSHKVDILEDVECNGRVFSDGVGTMSRAVMEKIYDNYPNALRSMPSCFQIRYRGMCISLTEFLLLTNIPVLLANTYHLGAKGMISLDTRLEGDALLLRDSMIKYEGSTSNDIEICEASYRPLPAYLNRQLIKIMEDMGVDENWFLKLQAQEVERLRTITDSPVNASSFLKRQSIGEPVHLPWLINELTMLNLDFREDGFLRDVLEVALLVELRMLKHKTRIPVPKGWHLHGIMDETGLLEEGQVFCVATVEGMRQFVTGKNLLITRAPALHPGDVQLVEGIEPPLDSPLRELSNCICFSQKGKRDLPSQLSGGDLDGDRYYIFWDEDAIPKTTYPPADYPRQKPIDIGRNVEVSDMTDFFIHFMETDQLGRIAVGHQVLSDQRDDGTLDEDCIKLAGLHSTAVDFSKTGIPVCQSPKPPPSSSSEILTYSK
jgi:hypothetical protein